MYIRIPVKRKVILLCDDSQFTSGCCLCVCIHLCNWIYHGHGLAHGQLALQQRQRESVGVSNPAKGYFLYSTSRYFPLDKVFVEWTATMFSSWWKTFNRLCVHSTHILLLLRSKIPTKYIYNLHRLSIMYCAEWKHTPTVLWLRCTYGWTVRVVWYRTQWVVSLPGNPVGIVLINNGLSSRHRNHGYLCPKWSAWSCSSLS